MRLCCLILSLLSTVTAFAPPFAPPIGPASLPSSQLRVNNQALSLAKDAQPPSDDCNNKDGEQASSRRDFLSSSLLTLGGTFAAATTGLGSWPMNVQAIGGSSEKVLVLGGTGFVGSRVVQKLQSMGVSVVSTSRDGRLGTTALDFTTEDGSAIQKKVKELASGCSAVISCIGSIGTPSDEAVNAGTGFAAAGAKQAGVDRFVYISVAPEVKEFAKDIDFLKGYMAGKTSSQDSIVSNFKQYTLIEPTFIYGGDEFKVNPPRVASFYGNFVEGVLSSGPLRALTNVAPEGFLKIALEPPVPVEAVANAAVAGALGKTSDTVLDTYDKIKQTSALL